MILCLCRGIPQASVGAVIADGAASLDDIVAACGAGSDCGACHGDLLDMVRSACARRRHGAALAHASA